MLPATMTLAASLSRLNTKTVRSTCYALLVFTVANITTGYKMSKTLQGVTNHIQC